MRYVYGIATFSMIILSIWSNGTSNTNGTSSATSSTTSTSSSASQNGVPIVQMESSIDNTSSSSSLVVDDNNDDTDIVANASSVDSSSSNEDVHFYPPLLLMPPQPANGNRTFGDQCVTHCLSAYEASPAYNHDGIHMYPRLLHYIFVGESDIAFTFMDYLVIRAAYFRLQPTTLYLHTNVPAADGPIWDLTRPMIDRHEHFDTITEIFNRSVSGRAHQSDIARLVVLQKYGGIYMDLDAVALRPFPKYFWNPPNGTALAFLKKMLACGVIMAQSYSSFLQRWYESYRTFNTSIWSHHCADVPTALAQQHPNEVTTLPEESFYVPYLDRTGLSQLWAEHAPNDTNMWQFDGSYAPHYWGTGSRGSGRIGRISASYILNTNIGLFQILRSLLPHPYFSVVWRAGSSTVSKEEAVKSVMQQSFPLWEIVIESDKECWNSTGWEAIASDRVRCGGEPRGVWKVEALVLSSDSIFDDILEEIRTNPLLRVHTVNDHQFDFIYNPASKGISRIPKP